MTTTQHTAAAAAADLPEALPHNKYLCQAWGETDYPVVAIVEGLSAVSAFLVEQWLGDADGEHDDGTKALPAAMADMQDEWAREGDSWKWSIDFEIGGISVQKVWPAALTASAPAAPTAPQAGAPAAPQLLKFYGFTNDAELIAAQAAHIERLQAKLPQAPSFAPQRVREG